MATYYIDFENVHNSGTIGIEQLDNTEYVYLFYSQNANTMTVDTVQRFMSSRCGVEFVEADTGTANSLDFQLITFLFSVIGQDDYHYIVSKDRGFDAAVKMGKRLGIECVERFNSISEAMRHYEREMKKLDEMSKVCETESVGEKSDTVSDVVISINDDKIRNKIKDKIKKIVQKESSITLPKEELDVSVEGICNCDNKMSLYHFLRKQLGDERGRIVYGALNEGFFDLKMSMAV